MSDSTDRSCCCGCGCGNNGAGPRRRFSFVRTLVSVALLYATLVFGGGSLIRTGHPVAVELGRIIQTVTFVEPGIRWAHVNGHDRLAGGLRWLSDGVQIG